MKKISLVAILCSAVLLLQNCKKDTFTGSTTSTEPMTALINDTTWIATNVTANLVYNSTLKTKIFTCTGLANSKQVNIMATAHNAINTASFPIASFTVNTTTDNEFSYEYPQPDANGNLVLTPQGVVGPGSGTVTISTIDSVKKVISGTFSFNSLKNNYDSNGNIVSISVATINAGGFNSIPYTFTSN